MNKSELIKDVAGQLQVSQKEAEKYINAFIEGIKTGLIADGKVSIYKTMTLELKDTKETSGTLKGVEWTKPAGKRIKTTYSDTFLEEIVGE